MTHEEREALEAYLKGIVLNLPEKPGSYQYYDDEGTIIYVGKAKNLKRRVSSYFNKEQQSRKTAMLVFEDPQHHLHCGEFGGRCALARKFPHQAIQAALQMYCSKTTRPILILPSRTSISPRVFKTRHRERRGATYYGPYSHLPTMYALLDLCQRLYHRVLATNP